MVLSIIAKKFEKSLESLTLAFPKLVAFELNSSRIQSQGKGILSFKKQIAAFTLLKSWIGNLYYMKKTTRLIYIGFAINIVLSLLLAV